MQDGQHIENYLHEIVFSYQDIEIRMTRRALKHIVEERRKDNYSPERICMMFEILDDILRNKTYTIIPNTETPNGFFLLEKIFTRIESIYMVIKLICINSNSYYVKTGFFRKVKKIKNF